MKYKIITFVANSNGRIELTKKELEDLLQQVFDEGFEEGLKALQGIAKPSPIYPSYPGTGYPTYTKPYEITTTPTDKIKITCENK